MNFYVVATSSGETIGCELTKKDAIAFAELRGYQSSEIEITRINANVSADTVRRLLGNLGGYANY